ncbi:hypothetical protein DXG01_006024 [Tephrocybe rancida]|nr:hypothetical protein DXG01_006024 [Tephrocybe rancida]
MAIRPTFDPPASDESLSSLAGPHPAQCHRTLSHGGDLSQASPRRSLRSSSARTALLNLNQNCDITRGSRANTSRTRSAVLPAPLFQGPRGSHTSIQTQCRRASASDIRPPDFTVAAASAPAQTLEYTNHTWKEGSRASTVAKSTLCPGPREPATRASARLRSKLLLRYARQMIEHSVSAMSTRPRRPRLVMDVLLDLQALGIGDDALVHLLRSHHHSIPSMSNHTSAEYTFHGRRMSLDKYWSEQAAVWSGTRTTVEGGISNRFAESDERSAASWAPGLAEPLDKCTVLSLSS